MALRVVQKATPAGLNPVYSAADVAGDTFVNTGREVLTVRTGATPTNVTITAVGQCDHGYLHDQVIAVPANAERQIGPFRDLARWNNPQGRVSVSYDVVTAVTIGLFAE